MVKFTVASIADGECSLAELAPPHHTCAYVDLEKKEEEGDDLWVTCAVQSPP
jgi:hypothetical protein